ncbi:DUF2933 domain-containing protein [Streptomyces sp. NPDC001100]
MKGRNFAPYVIVAALVLVGLVALGVPLSTLLFLVLVLCCPLMMFFMMRGMHGNDQHSDHENHGQDTDNQDRLHKHL